jgi:hypothetical protein
MRWLGAKGGSRHGLVVSAMRRLSENWIPIGKKMKKDVFYVQKIFFRLKSLYKINLDKKLAKNIGVKVLNIINALEGILLAGRSLGHQRGIFERITLKASRCS